MSKTPAERQRECRERKRDMQTTENVTHVTIEPERDMRARTVAIPGDPDYVGCCKQVDGVWVTVQQQEATV